MITYLVTGAIDNSQLQSIINRLELDVENNFRVNQIFFYADAVAVGTFESYSTQLEKLIDITDKNNISLSICSAGFKKRQLCITELTKQDFYFKGLGQFVAESSKAEITRLFPELAASENTSLESPPSKKDCKYDMLISLHGTCCQNSIKEYLEVALVSAAYDLSVAVFIAPELIKTLQSDKNIEVSQLIQMMKEFRILIYSDSKEMLLLNQAVKKSEYQQLALCSRHHYKFCH